MAWMAGFSGQTAMAAIPIPQSMRNKKEGGNHDRPLFMCNRYSLAAAAGLAGDS